MTATTVMSIVAVLLALLLLSAAWTLRKPAWELVFGPPADPPNRIPLTEFYVEAQKAGWNLTTDQQLCLDLAVGLREAGLDGSIEIWGRKCRKLTLPGMRDSPLQRIDSSFWQHHQVDGLRMVRAADAGSATETPRLETNNRLTRTLALPMRDTHADAATYHDLQLNCLQALHWLHTDAARYQGISRSSGAAPRPATGGDTS